MKRFRILLQRLRSFRFRRATFFFLSPSSTLRPKSLAKSKSKSKSILSWPSRNHHQSRMEKMKIHQHSPRNHNNRALLLACNPCAGSSSGGGSMVVESYRFQVQGEKRIPPPPPQKGENWQREKAWSIVTRVGDEFVTKKVILKKMKVRKPPRPKVEDLRADDPLENTCSSSSSSRYRLSTSSSSNADALGGLSWEKEMSFTSGDIDDREEFWSGGFDGEVFDRLEGSTKDVFVDPTHKHFPSPDRPSGNREHMFIHDENSQESPVVNVNVKVQTMEPTVTPGELRLPCGSYRSNCGASDGSPGKVNNPTVSLGVAVSKVSCDPYRDYWDSMLEMCVAYDLQEVCEYEELLSSYIELNPPECHGTIVKAFIELLRHRLFI